MRFAFLAFGLSLFSPKPPSPCEARMVEIGAISEAELAGPTAKIDEQIAAGVKHLFLRINSYGGDAGAMFDFIQHIEEAHKAGVTVTCAVDWKAMSAGFVILQSAACDERLMTRRSQILAHNGWREVGSGNAHDLRSAARSLDVVDRQIAEIVAPRLGLTIEAYKAKVEGRNWQMNWLEALSAHAVDGIADPLALPPLATAD